MKEKDSTIEWLLEGDPAIRWQVLRDLVGAGKKKVLHEQKLVAKRDWGARLLALQEPSGMWGGGIYSPKWTSTTYTMLLLRDLGLHPENPQALKACKLFLDKGLYTDGGINFGSYHKHSETCITGMVLSIISYFQIRDDRVHCLVDHLFEQQMKDGGWNCQSYRGATHSSFHTTISALEGLREYEKSYPQKASKVQKAQQKAREFLLIHKLFRSHRTGEIVHPAMTRFSFPPRWHYDVIRALDHFQQVGAEKDKRLKDAIEIVKKRQKKDGRWVLQNRYPGRTHFEMEKVGEPSRWNTLRALRILKWWQTG
jgi:hypothetical protein